MLLTAMGSVTSVMMAANETARLKSAVAALQQQPLLDRERQQIMEQLVAMANGASDTESRIGAAYLLGRLRQLAGETEEPLEFQALIEQHPTHPLAQLARVKLIMRRLYALTGAPPAARLEAAEALGAEITLPALQSDFHLVMGDAYIFFGDQREAALRHLGAAERLGIPSSATRGTVLVQIGELARLTGDAALARQSYQAFLDNYPRDIRQQIVRDRLAEVEARR